MRILEEFKEFAMRGNVIDLAVGVIMGAEFGKIVNSLVNDVLMPPIGFLIGGVNFSDLKLTLAESRTIRVPNPSRAGELMDRVIPPATWNYGQFLQSVLNFVIVAACIFALVKVMNRLKRKKDAAPVPVPADVALLTEIRDILKSR